ncbi:PIN domain-containing protein [Dactylosporangium sp. CA-233914]|uniref:PIN domain-containing protein n=1 Tax=Dactylosporangium sp. CA-233914 TaxID=3239934 RepID=UPI003D89DB26
MFTAVLDTCVLWPSLQRDFLLSLAVEGMYRPVWSSVILDELEYHEAVKLVSRGEEQVTANQRASRLVDRMRAAFDDAEVRGWEPLDGTFGLPDPNDEHVLAAAVVAGAGAVVTANVKDFPASRLPLGIEVLPPSEFAANTVALDPVRAANALSAIAQRSGKRGPERTVDQVLDALVSRYHMDQVAAIFRGVR